MIPSNNTYKRLVAFGASITFGHGLKDCYNYETTGAGMNPSGSAWPSLVAEKLGLYCENKGDCGAPNLKILLNVLNFDFETTDLVIILWNISDLSILFDDTGDIKIMGPNEEYLCKEFYMLHSEYDLSMRTLLEINHATNYLENKNLNVYNFYLDYNLYNFVSKSGVPRQLINSINHIKGTVNVDLGLDGKHPGPRSQAAISDWMLSHL